MKNIFGITSMNRMTKDFNTDNGTRNIMQALNLETLEEIPHSDTINNFLKKLEII